VSTGPFDIGGRRFCIPNVELDQERTRWNPRQDDSNKLNKGIWAGTQLAPVIQIMSFKEDPQLGAVLVIDDDAAILSLVKATLEPEGYTVHTASNAADGIKLYEAHWRNIEVVLLDFWMPGLNGDHVLEHLRSLDPGVRIVLLTGDKYSFERQLRASGICGCIEKPFDVLQLSAQIHQAADPR
jgi:CheY-like chemotaxis protein